MAKQPVMTRGIRVLLCASLLNWTTGNGLFPLLPLYALDRGATIEGTGVILAAGFAGLAAGSLIATWIARVAGGYGRGFVAAALLQAAAYALMGRVTASWQLGALLPVAWLGAGVANTLVQVMASLAGDPGHRGRAFGLLALAPPLGAVIGASLLGALVARGGYGWAFDAGSLLVLGAALVLATGRSREIAPPPAPLAAPRSDRAGTERVPAERGLLLSALLASTALFVGRLTTPVLMLARSFDPQAIAATAAVGGLVTAPFVLLIGDLSDRLGRWPVLLATSLLTAGALSMLAFADQLWQFALAAALLSLGFAASGSVAAALAGDLVSPALLPRALGRLSAVGWIAAVAAFAGGGVLLGHIAAPVLCLLAALIALSACLPLTASRPHQLRGRIAGDAFPQRRTSGE